MMNPFGALGLNGFPSWFYQKHQKSIGTEVRNFVLNVINQNASLTCVNDTYIKFIPKVKNAYTVGEFRPITIQCHLQAGCKNIG